MSHVRVESDESIIWSVLVFPKINNIGFGDQGRIQKAPYHRKDGAVRVLK